MPNIETELQKVVEQNEEILDKLHLYRIFELGISKNGKIEMREQCDNYFFMELTKKDYVALEKLFAELKEVIKE